MNKINWISKEVLVADIQPTEKNYKIRNALGRERLQESLKSFGLAGNVVCNWTGKVGDIRKLMLVDGNSRLEQAIEAKQKKIWASVPDRKLSAKEFSEMSAMFDLAKAGDIDTERIQGDLGTTKEFYEKWNLTVPKHLLDQLGKKQLNEYKAEKVEKKKTSSAKVSAERNLNELVMIQLIFDLETSEEFRKHEERLMKKFGTKSTAETVIKAFKSIK